MAFEGRELRSLVGEDGSLSILLETVALGDPADDEVIVRVEAAPINPSDLGLLVGPADIASVETTSGGLRFTIPPARLPSVQGRLGQSMPVGNEGAGVVVAAGAGVRALQGKRVAMVGGGMYADYRKIKAREVVPLPDGVTSAEGASLFVNPLTALGFVETAKLEGHKAIIHTAAASNLGQMLQKICLADGVPLVNIVRSQAQADILRGIGATHVLNSTDGDFRGALLKAVKETGATIAFDAIGGGTLGSDIVQAMERAAVSRMTAFSRYGSEEFKQLYIYGALDLSPTVLNRLAFGFDWSVSGWLLFPFMKKAGPEISGRMRQRVLDEIKTTFVSNYTKVIGLAEALQPDVLRAYERKATGEKYLIDPSIG
ncbi:alcohol dehydrogenase catalytic domain-containing protein [Sandaracinobacteroides hominis]|uniref:alcohol dehydrogenase catalytic domain-containing protein n=1 Tax=Sandaracinobacteroides hominis TaxID=2780086 RepID=UPI0018F3EF88|nr:zinc-binding dehydrogenase [Sandaracinobacteroides hominis]